MSLHSHIGIKGKIFAHIETWRPYTVIWCGLVSLSGSCIIHNSFPQLITAVLATFIPMMGWIAGLYLSDYLDKDLDRIQKPHRPIPSGRIRPNESLTVGGIFVIIGFFLSFFLSFYNVILVFFVGILVFTYAKMSKSQGIFGNFNRGFVTVVAFLYGVFSADQPIQEIPIYLWLLCLVYLIHDTNSNLVGAIRDREGDRRGGYKTIPVTYGLELSILISIILTIIWFSLLIGIPYYFKFLKIEFYYMIFIDFLIIISLYIYLIKSIKYYSREKALKFHEFFVIERIVLASAFIIGVADKYIAITIFIIAIIITEITQFILRRKYEFKE
jgi:4-hydroxybenzoate polyprenyltransferase/geranylgeranylglycerol-phosphate geranylgeranyltransferase